MADNDNAGKQNDSEASEKPAQPIPVRVVKNEEPIRVTDKRFWMQPEAEQQEQPQNYSFKPTYVEELESRLSESHKKLEEVLAAYRALKAESAVETQRAKERIEKEYNRRLDQAKSEVVGKFIDVLENFERATAAAKDTQSFESFLEGIELIRNQFVSALADLGLRELDLEGKPFNPELAEAVGVVSVDCEALDQQVMEVVSKGYLLQETLVRPARVKVGKGPEPSTPVN
jgi:molecular chaperone GrpE